MARQSTSALEILKREMGSTENFCAIGDMQRARERVSEAYDNTQEMHKQAANYVPETATNEEEVVRVR